MVVRNLLHGVNISTHAPRTGSDYQFANIVDADNISTHAPRTGSDVFIGSRPLYKPISTHAPRTGSDGFNPSFFIGGAFQPTLPARGATDTAADHQRCKAAFQPTLPARGATAGTDGVYDITKDFNPRSPHGERRTRRPRALRTGQHFNPRSPHGERPGGTKTRNQREIFQPTLPARGATCPPHHAVSALPFQPTLPARGATQCKGRILQYFLISTHAPRTGSDVNRCFRGCLRPRFQPTLPARGATTCHAQHCATYR